MRAARTAALLEAEGQSLPDAGPAKCCHHRRADRGALAAQVQVPKQWLAAVLDLACCLRLVLGLMWVPETLLVLLSAVLSVLVFDLEMDDFSVNVSWTAVSFLLMFPLQNAIKSAYQRREQAVQAVVELRAILLNVFLANARWDWPGTDGFCGRSEDDRPMEEGGRGLKKKPCNVPLPTDHSERVRRLLMRLVDALQDTLLVPRSGRPRHEFSACGRAEKREIDSAELQGRSHVIKLLSRLHGATEELKAAGMPANEASRINQYLLMLTHAFERLWAYKTYRTPVALRAMMRVLVQVLPFFYGPYWVHIARGDDQILTVQGMFFALFFSSLISLITIAMLNLEIQMENPFRFGNLDTVRVKAEMDLCRDSINEAFDDMSALWHERLTFEWEIVGTSIGRTVTADAREWAQ